jgi:hypothetical protein
MKTTKFYACGAEYGSDKKFKWVRPTGELPYVKDNLKDGEDLYSLCKHHSGLYEVDLTNKTAKCIRKGWESGNLPIPDTVKIEGELLQELIDAIEIQQFGAKLEP